ncbi:MAG: VanZ family protein [Clostridia bacterium]|nr:VanZ family protein [Clostridia bacterium]
MKKNILRVVLLILIFLWMYVVFGFSKDSGEASSGLSTKIASLFSKNENVISAIEPIIRKIAHLSEYAAGGFLFYGFFLTFKINPKIQITISILLGVIYAITDEIHQLFVPGRSGKIQDVCIDSIGVVIGVCVLLFFVKIIILIKDNIRKKETI